MAPNWGFSWHFHRSKHTQKSDEEGQIEDSSSGGIVSSPIEIEMVLKPNEVCLSHGGNPFSPLEDVTSNTDSFLSERVKLVVGSGTDQRKYLVHRSLLTRYSKYFAGAYRSSAFVESQTNLFLLGEDRADQMDVFLHWLYLCPHCKLAQNYEIGHVCGGEALSETELGADEAAMFCKQDMEVAWVLGDRFLAEDFMQFCIGHLVQHLDRLTVERLEWVYDNTAPSSALRRVVRQYVGYLNAMTMTGGGKENSLVQAAQRLDEETEETPIWSSRNPKKYTIEHWKNQECYKDMNATCSHRTTHVPKPRGRRSGPPILTTRKRIARDLSRVLWICMPLSILALSVTVLGLDKLGLVGEVSKRFSIAFGILAVIGIRYHWVLGVSGILALACGSIVLDDVRQRRSLTGGLNEILWQLELALGILEISYIFTTIFSICCF